MTNEHTIGLNMLSSATVRSQTGRASSDRATVSFTDLSAGLVNVHSRGSKYRCVNQQYSRCFSVMHVSYECSVFIVCHSASRLGIHLKTAGL